MLKCNKNILRRMLEHKNIQYVLEIGSGKCSTRMIRDIIKEKRGFGISLEDKIHWFKKMNFLCPKDKYGRVIKTNIIWDNNRVFLEYKSETKFDLILIDGPSIFPKINRKVHNHLMRYVSDKKYWINPYGSGMNSLHMLEYVSQFCKDDTIILVDRRIPSVYHYLQKFIDTKEFSFFACAEDDAKVSRRVCEKAIKKEYINSPEFEKNFINLPTSATVICKRDNKNINKFFEEIKIKFVPII